MRKIANLNLLEVGAEIKENLASAGARDLLPVNLMQTLPNQ